MTVDGERFIIEMLRAIRGEIGEVRERMIATGARMSAMDRHLGRIEARVASLRQAMEGLAADMRRVTQRLVEE